MRKYIILYRIIIIHPKQIQLCLLLLTRNGIPREDEGIIHRVLLSNNFLKYYISDIKISCNSELKESLIVIKAKSDSEEDEMRVS
jgi:hypothetical protein